MAKMANGAAARRARPRQGDPLCKPMFDTCRQIGYAIERRRDGDVSRDYDSLGSDGAALSKNDKAKPGTINDRLFDNAG